MNSTPGPKTAPSSPAPAVPADPAALLDAHVASGAGRAGVIRVGVLALQGDVREHVRALTAAGAEAVEVRRPEELASVRGLVIPGGESTTMGRLLGLFGLLDPLRRRVAGGLPVFGSCAGMILLAGNVIDGQPGQPLVGGLDIVVRRNAFGRQVDSFEVEVDVAGVGGGPVHAVFIRAPWVEKVGDGVQVLARVDGRVVAVRQGRLLATSFHPELTGDVRLHQMFVDMIAPGGDGWVDHDSGPAGGGLN